MAAHSQGGSSQRKFLKVSVLVPRTLDESLQLSYLAGHGGFGLSGTAAASVSSTLHSLQSGLRKGYFGRVKMRLSAVPAQGQWTGCAAFQLVKST
jgi:hypothetical protein